jgi:hypothetical protein
VENTWEGPVVTSKTFNSLTSSLMVSANGTSEANRSTGIKEPMQLQMRTSSA